MSQGIFDIAAGIITAAKTCLVIITFFGGMSCTPRSPSMQGSRNNLLQLLMGQASTRLTGVELLDSPETKVDGNNERYRIQLPI